MSEPEIDTHLIEQIPTEIREAALLLGNWMKENGHKGWKLYDCAERALTETPDPPSICPKCRGFGNCRSIDPAHPEYRSCPKCGGKGILFYTMKTLTPNRK